MVSDDEDAAGQMFSERNILRFDPSKGAFEVLKDVIAVEDSINLYVNDRFYATFNCVPQKMKEMVIGYLLTEGIISSVNEVAKIDFSGKNVHVRLINEAPIEVNKVISAVNSAGRKMMPRALNDALKLRFSVNVIFKAVEILNSMAKIYRASGGTHAATLLSESGEVLAFAEDVGRHNALDKAVGEAAIRNVDFSRTLLALTGRLTSEIVTKAVLVGIPIAVSLSAPTDKGIKIAEAFNLTLIGFARERRFNIYTFPNRISL